MYRTVSCDTWDDTWFSELDPQAKLFFLYLLTNRRSTPCGAFEIAVRAMSFETGIPNLAIQGYLKEFAPRVMWWEKHNIIWVRNFYKHQKCNENYRKGALNTALEMPAEVQSTIFRAYPELLPNPPSQPPASDSTVTKPLPSHSEPSIDGMQTGGKEEEKSTEEKSTEEKSTEADESRPAGATADPPNKNERSEPHSEPEGDPPKPPPNAKIKPVAFERVFLAYPAGKRESKAICIQKWDKARPSDEEVNAMLVFIEAAKRTDRWRGGFIKQFHVFLSERKWEDDLCGYADQESRSRNGNSRNGHGSAVHADDKTRSGWDKVIAAEQAKQLAGEQRNHEPP